MNSADIQAAMARRLGPGVRMQPFDEGNFAAAGQLAGSTVTVVRYVLPNMMQGQLEGFAFGSEVLGDFDQVIWQLVIDGSPWVGFDNMQGAPPGTFIFPKILPAPIPVRANGTIQMIARPQALLVGQIAATLLGTYWPSLAPEAQQDFPGHVTAQL